MAEKQKHTIEDVLAQYAQTEEGAKHLQEIEEGGRTNSDMNTVPSIPKNARGAAIEQNAAAQNLKTMSEEASMRPTMKQAHEMRQAEIQSELRDNGLGFIDVPLTSLPTGGIFYPEGTRINIRAASGADIRHWSMINETELSEIDDALNYIVERCVRISYPDGTANWKDLKEIDRFYIILAVRDFTFPEGNNDLKIKISENKTINVHKDHIQFMDLGDKIMKYFNVDKRCFTFPVKDPRTKYINIYMPSVGVTQWLKSYIKRKTQRQEQYDKDFVTVAPMLIADYRKLNDHTYTELLQKSMMWGNYEWSLVAKVKSIIERSISPKLKYTDESGAEAEAPLTFQGGIKAIFTINMDEELDL